MDAGPLGGTEVEQGHRCAVGAGAGDPEATCCDEVGDGCVEALGDALVAPTPVLSEEGARRGIGALEALEPQGLGLRRIAASPKEETLQVGR